MAPWRGRVRGTGTAGGGRRGGLLGRGHLFIRYHEPRPRAGGRVGSGRAKLDALAAPWQCRPMASSSGSSGSSGSYGSFSGGGSGGQGGSGYGGDENSDERRLRERLEKLLPEVVRRAINMGSSAISNTEDGIRRLVSEFNLPRDVAAYLMVQASASKDEVLRIISEEIRKFLETVNLSGELQKLLTSLSFEIKTEIRFIPNDQAVVKPEVKSKTTMKRRDGKEEEL